MAILTPLNLIIKKSLINILRFGFFEIHNRNFIHNLNKLPFFYVLKYIVYLTLVIGLFNRYL